MINKKKMKLEYDANLLYGEILNQMNFIAQEIEFQHNNRAELNSLLRVLTKSAIFVRDYGRVAKSKKEDKRDRKKSKVNKKYS
jgi:hypothetical protein